MLRLLIQLIHTLAILCDRIPNGKRGRQGQGEGARRNWNGIPLGMQYVDGILRSFNASVCVCVRVCK